MTNSNFWTEWITTERIYPALHINLHTDLKTIQMNFIEKHMDYLHVLILRICLYGFHWWGVATNVGHAMAQVGNSLFIQGPRFNPRPLHVTFFVQKVALWQVFLSELQFSPLTIIPPMLHTHSFIHLSLKLQLIEITYSTRFPNLEQLSVKDIHIVYRFITHMFSSCVIL